MHVQPYLFFEGRNAGELNSTGVRWCRSDHDHPVQRIPRPPAWLTGRRKQSDARELPRWRHPGTGFSDGAAAARQISGLFQATNQVNFMLEPVDGGTRVSSIMDGKNNFMSKAMSLIMDMDKMVGKDFEQGLANLDVVAQKPKKR